MPATFPLTVVILAKNEASRIEACIRSVQGWAAEVLVVDDESADDTAALAERLGARVIRRRMEIEGRHRNWAHSQAQHEWILSLDADERVTPALAEEITQALASGSHETYAIPRRNYIGERWLRYGGWYPSAQLKLFKRSVFRWEEVSVHPRAFGPPAGTLKADLLHYSYRDTADYRRKLERQTALEAQKWVADQRRMSVGKALWRTIDRFFRTLVLKQGFRDGRLGWFAAWMGGAYQWKSYQKYRALRHAA
jgi:glycosyltransferase involved in cell wall biosynthesis